MQSNHELNAKPLTTNYTFANTPLKTHCFNKIRSHMLVSFSMSTSKVLTSMAWPFKTREKNTRPEQASYSFITTCLHAFPYQYNVLFCYRPNVKNSGDLPFRFHKPRKFKQWIWKPVFGFHLWVNLISELQLQSCATEELCEGISLDPYFFISQNWTKPMNQSGLSKTT